MVRISLKYAVICGVFLYVLFVVSFFFDINPFINLAHLFFDFAIFFLFVLFAAKEFKRYDNDGFLHFWQGMTIGFLLYAPAIALFALLVYFQNIFDHSVLGEYKVEAMKYLQSRREVYLSEFGQEQYDAQVSSIEEMTFGRLLWSSVVKKIMVGLFVTPIISIFLRKKPK